MDIPKDHRKEVAVRAGTVTARSRRQHRKGVEARTDVRDPACVSFHHQLSYRVFRHYRLSGRHSNPFFRLFLPHHRLLHMRVVRCILGEKADDSHLFDVLYHLAVHQEEDIALDHGLSVVRRLFPRCCPYSCWAADKQ